MHRGIVEGVRDRDRIGRAVGSDHCGEPGLRRVLPFIEPFVEPFVDGRGGGAAGCSVRSSDGGSWGSSLGKSSRTFRRCLVIDRNRK
jgi:hypothetical protein